MWEAGARRRPNPCAACKCRMHACNACMHASGTLRALPRRVLEVQREEIGVDFIVCHMWNTCVLLGFLRVIEAFVCPFWPAFEPVFAEPGFCAQRQKLLKAWPVGGGTHFLRSA